MSGKFLFVGSVPRPSMKFSRWESYPSLIPLLCAVLKPLCTVCPRYFDLRRMACLDMPRACLRVDGSVYATRGAWCLMLGDSVHKAIGPENVFVFPAFFAAIDWCETRLIRHLATPKHEDGSVWANSRLSRKDSQRY